MSLLYIIEEVQLLKTNPNTKLKLQTADAQAAKLKRLAKVCSSSGKTEEYVEQYIPGLQGKFPFKDDF